MLAARIPASLAPPASPAAPRMRLARHKALILEDHAPTAALLAQYVASIEHDHRICATLDELRVAIAEGGYCYALVDKELPAVAGDPPLTMTGDTAMKALRKEDPRYGAEECHVTPILVVTGSSTHHKFVDRQFKLGADGFIAKPFAEKPEDVVAEILDCLRRAGRADHADCARLALQLAESAPVPAAPAAKGVRFVFDGVRIGKRTTFQINGKRRDLQDAFFVILLRLAAAKLRDPDALTSAHELGFATVPQAPSRIRKACADQIPEGFELIQNVRSVGFRLHPLVVVEPIDWAVFETHPDPAVQRVALLERKRPR